MLLEFVLSEAFASAFAELVVAPPKYEIENSSSSRKGINTNIPYWSSEYHHQGTTLYRYASSLHGLSSLSMN